MKSGIQYILSLLCVSALFFACSSPENLEEQTGALAQVELSLDGGMASLTGLPTKAPAASVNRILILPFQKLNSGLPDDRNDNFIPAWNFAKQLNVGGFPVQNLVLGLPKSLRYKVLIIGYKQTDYDYYNQNSVSNLVELASQPMPTTLANFRLAPKSPSVVPEFYTCLCTAVEDGVPIGTAFTPVDATTIALNGQLRRFVGQLTVSVTGIPGFVKSMTLTAGNLVNSVQVNDTIATSVQIPGDGASRVIQTLTPSAGNVNFSTFLLPTLSTNKTTFSLIVKYGSASETYLIKVPDSPVSQNNYIILRPNGIVNISGTYLNINIGFEIGRTIDLDDNNWDGVIYN